MAVQFIWDDTRGLWVSHGIPGLSVSLQLAYDGGDSIDTDPGAVELTGTGGLLVTGARIQANGGLDVEGGEGARFKKKPWVDVTHPDFGAVGDGVTDDTAALVAAFAALEDGDTIVFPPGTYMVDRNALEILNNHITMIGLGGAAIKSNAGSGNSSILLTIGDIDDTIDVTDFRMIGMELP